MSKKARAAIHIFITFGTLGLMLASGQNARVLLWAYCFFLLYRMPTVWYVANHLDRNSLSALLLRGTRKPTRFDRGKPYRGEKTREPAGIASYIVGILTMMFMVGVVLAMSQGPGFLKADVIIPEMVLAAVIGLVYWLEDLVSQDLIIDPEKAVYQNLGYNTPAMNFLLAAIFISAFLFLMSMFAISFLLSDQPEAQNQGMYWISWAIIIVMALLKLAFQVRADLGNPRGFQALSEHTRGKK